MRVGRSVAGLLTVGVMAMAAEPVAANPVERPFTATFSGEVAMPSPGLAIFDGAGRAVHLGRIEAGGQAQVTGFDEATCPGGVANVHVESFTAANGDTLTITSLDVACPVAPGTYDGTGQWTVTGGTGRFAGATGQGSFDGTVDFVSGTYTITLEGTIAYGG